MGSTKQNKFLFRFVQIESFPKVSKSVRNSRGFSKTLDVAKLFNIEENDRIRVKSGLNISNLESTFSNLQCQEPIIFVSRTSFRTISVGEGALWKFAQKQFARVRDNYSLTCILIKWFEKCFDENQIKFCQIWVQSNSSTDGRLKKRATWWTCGPIHSNWNWLLRTNWSPFPTTFTEEMVLFFFTCLTTRTANMKGALSLDT